MQKRLGTQELELVRFVSNSQTPLSTREIAKLFGEPRDLARTTTILTMLERLKKKGYLIRTEVNGIHHYESKVSKEEFLQGVVRNFVEKTLEGSLFPFVAYLTQEAKISDAELADLRRLIDGLDRNRVERKDE
jgi:predicted transcriptional regulator